MIKYCKHCTSLYPIRSLSRGNPLQFGRCCVVRFYTIFPCFGGTVWWLPFSGIPNLMRMPALVGMEENTFMLRLQEGDTFTLAQTRE